VNAYPPEFFALADAIHEAMSKTEGCKHPRFQPAECTLIAKHLWDKGYRLGTSLILP
jgi:hypothetical protein